MIFAAFSVAAAFGFWGIPKLFPPSYEKSSPVDLGAAARAVEKKPEIKPAQKAPEPDQPIANKPAVAPVPAKDGSVDSMPEILRKVDPELTESAKRANVTGSVRLAFFINPTGFPSQIRVVRGMGYGLNRKAIDAVSHWRFRPITKDGHPVEVQLEVPFR